MLVQLFLAINKCLLSLDSSTQIKYVSYLQVHGVIDQTENVYMHVHVYINII